MTLLSAVAAAEGSPVDGYLAEQADLTAVERFSQRHEGELVPRQARYYRDLIPLGRPEPGQQYGFEVDLDACTGCKACVTACHSLNGLDDGESWRTVSLFSGERAGGRPFQQTVTAACHHCVDPACLSGCPVDAYEKDPVTGIVSHLDDQCIGCGYCTLSCPYEVPVYNHRRGIVRKCDMCHGRLAAGEAPACVQACPNGAITITLVDVADARAGAAGAALVPGTPPSDITVPTTRYVTADGWQDSPTTSAAPAGPARAHPPLAVMLVLTQLSVGAFASDLVRRLLTDRAAGLPQTVDAIVAVAAGVLALGASVLHLGRPRYCYRAVIGLRHSWLSREVVAFGAFTALAVPYAVVLLVAPGVSPTVAGLLGGVVVASGLGGVGCSVLIYTTTHRATWQPVTVILKFALTAAACGLATVIWASAVSATLTAGPVSAGHVLPLLLAAVMGAKLVADWKWRGVPHPELRSTTRARFAAGLAGGVALPLLLARLGGLPAWLVVSVATPALVGVVAGELLERSLFFSAASAPR